MSDSQHSRSSSWSVVPIPMAYDRRAPQAVVLPDAAQHPPERPQTGDFTAHACTASPGSREVLRLPCYRIGGDAIVLLWSARPLRLGGPVLAA